MDKAEQQRRHNEISAFAAMALGNDSSNDKFGSVNLTGASTAAASADGDKKNDDDKNDNTTIDSAVTTPTKASADNLFAQAVQNTSGSFSGTFSIRESSSQGNSFGGGGSQNLRTAAAAFQEAAEPTTTAVHPTSPPPPRRRAAPRVGTPPMFGQTILFARPSFFGRQIPPRVLAEARTLCRADPATELRQARPAVRNLVGALRVYGGWDVWHERPMRHASVSASASAVGRGGRTDNNTDTDNDTARAADAHNQLQCWAPVWYPQRVQLIREFQQQLGPAHMARARTAPARLLGEMVDLDLQQQQQQSQQEQQQPESEQPEHPTSPGSIPHAHTDSPRKNNAMGSPTPSSSSLTPNEQFSAWLRGGGSDDGSYGGGSTASPMQNSFDLGSANNNNNNTIMNTSNDASTDNLPETEAQMFSRLALGGGGGGGSAANLDDVYSPVTFQRIPSFVQQQQQQQQSLNNIDNDSDNDSINFDESRRQVGMNDHLTKAAASLEQSDAAVNDLSLPNANSMVPPFPQQDQHGRHQPHASMTATTAATPLSNYALTQCIPVYGTDDPALPVEGDLGNHETKEEQERTSELKRTQEWIKQVTPNVFGSIACPNPATSVDDVSQYQERHKQPDHTSLFHHHNHHPQGGATANTTLGTASVGGGADSLSVPSLQQPLPGSGTLPPRNNEPRGSSSVGSRSVRRGQPRSSTTTTSSVRTPRGRRPTASSASAASSTAGAAAAAALKRHGWWTAPTIDASVALLPDIDNNNNSNNTNGTNNTNNKGNRNSRNHGGDGGPNSGNSNNNNNNNAARLESPPLHHSALMPNRTISQLKPTAEDLWKENLPLSRLNAATTMEECLPYLADRPPSYRYLQIDVQTMGFVGLPEIEPLFCSLAVYNVETIDQDSAMAPVPNLSQCRRITEVLNFDVVSGQTVAQACEAALWPYHENSPQSKLLGEESPDRFTPTRCGVFPLPSNFQLSHLYAVLIVQKVLSDESNVEVYLKKKSVLDIQKLQRNAAKASVRNGAFLLPFCFGVAPIVQVFGADNPDRASSRAVQIPLFRYSPDLGERQIFEHIMIMLHPPSRVSIPYPQDSKNGVGRPTPAAETNQGRAVLVMRNFGYLGLHTVVVRKSSLARNRLVDFTGEFQLRLKTEDEIQCDEAFETKKRPFTTVCPEWQPKFTSEPTTNGGRNPERLDGKPQGSLSPALYAQELAPIPLSETLRAHVDENDKDLEPYFRTAFCNELLFHPRLLQHAPKSNIVIKAELREIEPLDLTGGVMFAHLPQCGPSIHNTRRGPFLVQSVFTACSPRGSQPNFIDEFKLKLPLDLECGSEDQPRFLAIVFTVYSVKISSKNKWRRAKKMFTTNTSSASVDSGSDNEEDAPVTKLPRLEQVGAGYLRITDSNCILGDDVHGVNINYRISLPPRELVETGEIAESGIILKERNAFSAGDLDDSGRGEESVAESWDESAMSMTGGATVATDTATRTDVSVASMSDLAAMIEGSNARAAAKLPNTSPPICLMVRTIVHSSVHPQNETLAEFLRHEPSMPCPSTGHPSAFLSTLAMGKDYLVDQVDLRRTSANQELEETLARLTTDISRKQLCSLSVLTEHIFRVMPVLWRQLLVGSGNPDLTWANPGALLSLRIESFASILNLFGAVMLYMSTGGTTLTDGVRKLDSVTWGRVVSLLFDEESLFGEQAREKFDEKYFVDKRRKSLKEVSPPIKTPTKHGHRRRNFSLVNDTSKRNDPDLPLDFSSLGLSPVSDPSHFDAPIQTHPEEDQAVKVSTSLDLDTSTVSKETEQPKSNVKPDSKADFQSAMRAGMTVDDAVDRNMSRPANDGAQTAQAMIQAFGSASGNRRWMTAPSLVLSTIRESDDLEGETSNTDFDPVDIVAKDTDLSNDSLVDNEVVQRNENKVRPRQMRVPKRANRGVTIDASLFEPGSPRDRNLAPTSVPRSDKDIETAGTAFLDALGKSLGISRTIQSQVGEEKRVGSAHHKKAHSRSSIDWTLINDNGSTSFVSHVSSPSPDINASESEDTTSELREEQSGCVCLPSFVERLSIMYESTDRKSRWFPYVYEVLIMQWSSILCEKEKKRSSRNRPKVGESAVDDNLLPTTARLEKLTATSAPMLFEVIKKSLGYRVSLLFSAILSKDAATTNPPVVALDSTIMENLEKIVVMVTDACIDSRNFDKKDLRKLAFDVNDSVVRFLRDLYSILSPRSVSGLIVTYMQRFTAQENRMKSGDSRIGLNYAWEITKLQLNAVTGLIRFPDFVRVSNPQMLCWGDWWVTAPQSASASFFDAALARFESYSKTAHQKIESSASFRLYPHWLAELVVDVCLQGTEHAEVYIQHRASSLLHELFWTCSQENVTRNRLDIVASMFVTFIEKLLTRINFLSSFRARSQLRKDITPCVVFVLQSTPVGLLRALWRKLCSRLKLRQQMGNSSYDGLDPSKENAYRSDGSRLDETPDARDMFTLLNMALRSVEYEGSEENLESHVAADYNEAWKREFVAAQTSQMPLHARPNRGSLYRQASDRSDKEFSSSTSRKWYSHDSSLVIVNAGHQIATELYQTLRSSVEGEALLNPAIYGTLRKETGSKPHNCPLGIDLSSVIGFVRAACSLYLHALSLRQSDVVLVRTFKLSAELIKMFGIRTYLEAVGETLQHWLRVISFHCGARRANVRVEATDLIELILRSTWECYGSFFRVRVPLFAVFTEVMERIVATASARYSRQQRLQGNNEPFSPVAAEASLVPLWRTLDRIQTQPASQNTAFRGALVRMAEKMKILYRAYIAARVLAYIQGAESKSAREDEVIGDRRRDQKKEELLRANRISILLVLNASEGFSKQFLGVRGIQQHQTRVAHFEAVEDALMDAANVFSATELPEHRVAWLEMLAEFHETRSKHAEGASCHFQIHLTYQRAASLHRSLWSSTPFQPWTDPLPDAAAIESGDASIYGDNSLDDGQDSNHSNSFRRIFFRVAKSVALNNFSLEDGFSKTLYGGVTFPHEHNSLVPWISLREMEEKMVNEAEIAGELFLKADIVESSRLSWNLAATHYADKFNYGKLADTYHHLSNTVVSTVPPVDASLPQEVSATLGRFYRVWFHGGAPDELSGIEFVHRAEGDVKSDKFGDELTGVIKSIIPDNTPIHLIHDGRTESRVEDTSLNMGFSRIGAALEPVRIKVTPLRPQFGSNCRRGLPEWFSRYVDEATLGSNSETRSQPSRLSSGIVNGQGLGNSSEKSDHRHRHQTSSFSPSVFSSAGSLAGTYHGMTRENYSNGGQPQRSTKPANSANTDLSGVDKFCFLQPKDRSSRLHDWWKQRDAAVWEKSLKVTQLHVNHQFPACVSRQAVMHRLVYSQSPLEAGVDAVCQWCSVLFRTAVATSSMSVLKANNDTGIGTDAAKVVAVAIHSSHVKEIGSNFLMADVASVDHKSTSDYLTHYDKLSLDEIQKLQLKLTKLIVVFIQLLHVLIVRNRNILLSVIKQRKRNGEDRIANPTRSRPDGNQGRPKSTSSHRRQGSHGTISEIESVPPPQSVPRSGRRHQPTDSGSSSRAFDTAFRSEDMRGRSIHRARLPSSDQSYDSGTLAGGAFGGSSNQGTNKSESGTSSASARTDAAIALQSELQRAFVNMNKTLYPIIKAVLDAEDEEIPEWLGLCCQDNYFSMRTYRLVAMSMPIVQELWITPVDLQFQENKDSFPGTNDSPGVHGSETGSQTSRGSDMRYGFGSLVS